MRIISSTDARAVTALLDRRPRRDPALLRRVARIVERVRRGGDRQLLALARRLDGLREPIEVSRDEIEAGASLVPAAVRRAIRFAARNVRTVARQQVPRSWSIAPVDGVRISQRVVPLDTVGCYVPGGRYPLPSSLLMTALPARAAGVSNIIAVCPRPAPVVMAAALEAGVTRLFRIGGAHAIAALAYGTATIPRVDKIVGPGNAWVAGAKALVAADCAIDFFAGPSEIAVVSDRGRAPWIAADLLAQAEHDPDARAILFTPSRRLAAAVAREIDRQMPAAGPAKQALARNGGIVVTKSLDEAVALAERLAPEHAVCDTEAVASRLTRAGTVFVGHHSAQACGDYVTGSNHVLPTMGAAAARGGLSAADFVRMSTVQRISGSGLRAIAPAAIALARAEGLSAHAASMAIRLTSGRQNNI
jgi:histidinol dehydrogenase